jgi:predicted metalloprotease with PDZ domain
MRLPSLRTPPRRLLFVLAAVCPMGCAETPPAAAAPTAPGRPVEITVDATDAPRHLLHAHLVIPAHPGPLTLQYPRWIPGEHAPSGPIVNLSGLRMSAAGKPVPWVRDSEHIFEFHLTVPPGAAAVEIDLDYLEPTAKTAEFSGGVSTTVSLAEIIWNHVVLYPKGASPAALPFVARLRLPPGWKYGTALPVAAETGSAHDTVEFRPASLETLIDSPVVAGAHLRTIPLGSDGGVPHVIDAVADSEEALAMTPQQLAAYKQLVAEAGALFGAHHYRDYHFLYSLSDQITSFGLEHHESSDDRVPERTLLEDDRRRGEAELLPHEFVHSWNGKYRRPRGLATRDYQEPMRGELLWVYEGLTQYLGWVLTGRSGLLSEEEERERVATAAAYLDLEPGRGWRSLEDTAIAAQVLYGAPTAWHSMRRGVDFYNEGLLIWLDADVTIRNATQGQKSLDDFCHAFHGGKGGAPEVRPYDLQEIIRTLDAVAPHDWKGFFETRVSRTAPRAPMGGIVEGGYKLAWSEEPNERNAVWDRIEKGSSAAAYSLGISLDKDGVVQDAIGGLPAALAGVVPDMKVVAIDGRRYSSDLLHAALVRAKGGAPIELIVESGDFFKTVKLDARTGERYPHLERDPAKADVIAKILAPRTPRPAEAVMAPPKKDSAK